MSLGLQLLALVGGIAVIQWGAQRVASLLTVIRERFGLAEAGCGALLGIATASPEISINIASVAFGWPEIGLGAVLGSNVPALPLIMSIAYLSMRWHRKQAVAARRPPPIPIGMGDPALQLKKHSVVVQALPYLLVTALVGLISLPPAWAGLQPIDAVVLLGAFAAFFGQAVLRKREMPRPDRKLGRPLTMAAGGIIAIALGAVGAVWATNHLSAALGISALVGGLFITGMLCALPEAFAAWPLTADGRATATASTALADGTYSVTLAFVPLALVATEVGDVALYGVNLATIGAMIILYIVVSRRKPAGYVTGREVLVFDGAYALYLAVVLYVLSM